MKKLFVIFLISSAFYVCLNYDIPYVSEQLKRVNLSVFLGKIKMTQFITAEARMSNSDNYFQDAYTTRKSNVPFQGSGNIINVLDDQLGIFKYQRCIVTLSSGQVVVVKHKIKDNVRIPLKKGDRIIFSGIYNWTKSGGEVIKTDIDSQNKGWIRYNGKFYQ